MKIGVVTITSGQNYGNRLQNYAMQCVLEKQGHQVETIRKEDSLFSTKLLLKLFIKRTLKLKYDRIAKRICSFRKFDKKNVKYSKSFIKSDGVDMKLSDKYDAFVCGSDQIWNPNFKINTDSYFLSFVSGKKKIAVSASFGIDKIEENDKKERIGKLLDKLDAVAVREQAGKKIVEEISAKDATVLIDPTFMLTPEQWEKIEKKPRCIKNKKYIFCYFLGEHNRKVVEEIRDYAKKNNLEVVFLENEYYMYKITTEEEFSFGPSEFIWLIRNSQKVITDSFHAVVFSLLFEKRFLVVQRDLSAAGDMNSRFSNLSELFGISDFMFDNEKRYEKDALVDYHRMNDRLQKERKKFIKFLQDNLVLK